ncbi:hypothetical protein [Delftia sp. GW456-R20]|uniref:hypothetical protein n=1 Tax=Delftia sp. GW456-R20 TaxID=1827145 RepID=UPI0018D42DB1|nr:hypothetical protein [Delftia sp. GW456-R20]
MPDQLTISNHWDMLSHFNNSKEFRVHPKIYPGDREIEEIFPIEVQDLIKALVAAEKNLSMKQRLLNEAFQAKMAVNRRPSQTQTPEECVYDDAEREVSTANHAHIRIRDEVLALSLRDPKYLNFFGAYGLL